MTKELDWCQRNQDLITRKARKLYDLRLNHSMENINLTRRCCDFKKLEAVLERRLAKTQSNEYEPKEKAVAASAEIPVRHPAIIRRRKNRGCKKKVPRKKAAILLKSKTAVFFCGIIKVS